MENRMKSGIPKNWREKLHNKIKKTKPLPLLLRKQVEEFHLKLAKEIAEKTCRLILNKELASKGITHASIEKIQNQPLKEILSREVNKKLKETYERILSSSLEVLEKYN